MKINRNNYEEYFILYMDNELDLQGRRMVESFLNLHPDLREELDILLQYKLAPDTNVVFEGKDELLKSTAGLPEDLRSWMLDYIDGELAGEKISAFQTVIAGNADARAELSLLQKTKLQPESIQFQDKQSLYRAENSRTHSIKWWRIAAAAILLIGIGTTAIIISNSNNKEDTEVVRTEPRIIPSIVTDESENPVILNVPVITKEVVNEPSVKPELQQPQSRGLALNEKISEKKKVSADKTNTPVLQRQDVIAYEKIPTNDLPAPVQNPNVKNERSHADVAKETFTEGDNTILTNKDVTTQSSQPYILHTSLTESDELDQPDSKKNKLRGFFRKVARTFEKRTNIETTDDDNKLLVAGLAINLK